MEESKWHNNFQSLLDVIACTQPNLQNQPMLLCLYRLVPRHTETSPHLLQGLDRRQLASHFEGRALASGGFWGARAISASAFYIFSFCFSSAFLKGHPQWRGSANEMSQPGRARVQRGWREDSAAQSSGFSARLCPLRAKSQPSEPRHQSLRKAPGTSSVIAALAVWIEKCQQDY